MRWHKVLAVFFASSSVLFVVSLSLFTGSDIAPPVRTAQLACIVVGVATFATSIAAWLRYRWSLSALRALVVAALLCLVCLGVVDVLPNNLVGHHLTRVILEDISIIAALATVPALLLTILYHRDVAADFGRHKSEP